MRTALAITFALALAASTAARAADTTSPLSKAVTAYQQQVVRVIERFENGAVATVDVIPWGQYRIASSGNQDPVFILKIATQPVPDVSAPGSNYTVKSLGTKTLDGVNVSGYAIASADKSFMESVWLTKQNLPMHANIQTQGHVIDVMFGDYNDSALTGTK